MSIVRKYRFKVTPTFGALAYVKMQRHIWGPIWETVDSMIPLNSKAETPLPELVEWAKDELWQRESDRLDRRAYWSGKPVPTMEEV